MGHSKFSESEVYLLAEQVDSVLNAGGNVTIACQLVGVPESTYYYWRRSRPSLFDHLQETHSSREAAAVRRLGLARLSISRLRNFVDQNFFANSTGTEQIQENMNQLNELLREVERAVLQGTGSARMIHMATKQQVEGLENTNRSYEVSPDGELGYLVERGQGKQSIRCHLRVYWKAAIILERLWKHAEGYSFPDLLKSLKFEDESGVKDYELRVCLRFWIACQFVTRHQYRYRSVSHQLTEDLKNSNLPPRLAYKPDYIQRVEGGWGEAVLRMHSDGREERKRL